MKLIIASKNQHKLKEIKSILSDLPDFQVVSFNKYPKAPDVVEDGKTFHENAIKKAQEMAKYTGELVLADDSGLEVKALDGAPGVRSARYAGEGAGYQKLCQKLLKNMKKVPDGERSAQFVTVIAIANPDELIGLCKGTCRGEIVHEMKGKNGFGYDPVFYFPPAEKTLAELSPKEKNKISHRNNALV